MTPENDYWSAMTRLPHQTRGSLDRDLDALGNGGVALSQDLQDVAVFLTQLRGLVDRPAPPPSAELASVLAHGFTPRAPSTPTNRKSTRPPLSTWLRRGALAFGLSAGLSASLVGGAAASGQLPDGAQKVVNRIVEAVTPFDVGDDSAQESPPTDADSSAPEPPAAQDDAGHDTRTDPSFDDHAADQDGVDSRRSEGSSGSRTKNERDSTTETGQASEERSGSPGGDSDDDVAAGHDDDPAFSESEDGEGPADGEGSSDGEAPSGGEGSSADSEVEHSAAEQDQDD